MSIRKRTWTSKRGTQTAWIVDYSVYDPKAQKRIRAIRTFDTQREAQDFAASTHVQIGKGLHVPNSRSVTIAQAGQIWIEECHAAGLERASIKSYEDHLRLHIAPFIGRLKLLEMTVPVIASFERTLREHDRSPAMVRTVCRSLHSIFSHALENGLCALNPVAGRKRRKHADRHKKKLRIGIAIPTPDEIRLIIAAAEGKWRPFFLTAIFTGLRASELRGLRWIDLDLAKGELHVRQRADRWNVIGRPKSAAGERSVPIPPLVVQELRKWKLQCPKLDGKLHFVFASAAGNPYFHPDVIVRGLIPTMLRAGVLDESGTRAKYSGMHSLRHFFASWCINRKVDGGLELPPKVVQERMGHASIQMTLDTYGHLFPRGDDHAELALAEQALFAR